MTDPERLYHDPVLAGLYDTMNAWGPDFDFCVARAQGAQSVLDIGCGTGQLAATIAPGRRVTGLDPAAAMLERARTRPGGHQVTWVMGDARGFDLGERFDLIVLTGHAFQVFLSDADQLAVLQGIARHLTPKGRFLFDSRNPVHRGWKSWTPDRTLEKHEAPGFGSFECRTDHVYDEVSGVLAYSQIYTQTDTGATLHATSRIRYTTKADLHARIRTAGLEVNDWYGDWYGTAWTPVAKVIIPFGGLQ